MNDSSPEADAAADRDIEARQLVLKACPTPRVTLTMFDKEDFRARQPIEKQPLLSGRLFCHRTPCREHLATWFRRYSPETVPPELRSSLASSTWDRERDVQGIDVAGSLYEAPERVLDVPVFRVSKRARRRLAKEHFGNNCYPERAGLPRVRRTSRLLSNPALDSRPGLCTGQLRAVVFQCPVCGDFNHIHTQALDAGIIRAINKLPYAVMIDQTANSILWRPRCDPDAEWKHGPAAKSQDDVSPLTRVYADW